MPSELHPFCESPEHFEETGLAAFFLAFSALQTASPYHRGCRYIRSENAHPASPPNVLESLLTAWAPFQRSADISDRLPFM